MKEIAIKNFVALGQPSAEIRLEAAHRRWTIGLVMGSLLGAISGLSGMAISFLSLVRLIERGSGLNRMGTWLIVVSFPLFWFSAHTLDKIRHTETEIRREYCKRHGLGEDC